MAAIRDLAASAARFVSRAGAAAGDYAEAAAAKADEWYTAASAAEPNFAAGIQAALAEKRYTGGVRRAGAEKYRRGVAVKGSVRFGPGVAAAEGEWAEGFRPFHAAIAGMTLPPRKPRRDPGNLQRVAAVVNLMIETAKRRT